ncbi:hypothetical protein F5Y04DRAFT_116551 [Hypomontagnella monticulosa]|nr:hypothetical protein F5Y04DRAFT_116551 [Hypomontagnella monticulosa]
MQSISAHDNNLRTYNMPPSNSRREPEDSLLWRKPSRMSRKSTLQPRGSWEDGTTNSNSFAKRRLRARLIAGRSPDEDDDDDSGGRGRGRGGGDSDDDGDGRGKGRGGGRGGGRDGGRGGGGGGGGGRDGNRDFRGFGDGPDDGKKSKDSDDSKDNDSDDDDDNQSTSNPPQPSGQPAAPSSGSVVTMTAIPPSRQSTAQPGVVTTSLPQSPSPSIPNQLLPTPTNARKIPEPSSGKEVESDPNTNSPSPIAESQVTATPTPVQNPTETSADTASATTTGANGMPEFSMGDNNNNNNNNNDGRHRGPPGAWRGIGSKNNNSKGLDPTAEHLLIAAGAIGAFILFCFVGWIVYRVMKRSKAGKLNGGKGMGFIDKLVWRRREPVRGTLDGRTLYLSNEAPPIYEKGEYVTSGTFYGPGKAYPPVPGTVVRSIAGSETGTLEKLPNGDPVLVTVIDQYAPRNDEARSNGDVNLTIRSQLSQPYYTVSELNRQTADTYNAPKRAGNRNSELSSISSGFGDGDIIVPPPLAVNRPVSVQEPDRPPARESWISRNNSKRETVYTEASEDRPARFRSISSWVNQQAGRAKRAGSRQRERGEVPVMPAIPGELSVTQQTVYR